MMDPPRIRIWGPPNNPIKYQSQITPKSTRVIHKVCQISLVRAASAVLSADEPYTQGENAGFTKKITFSGSS